MNIITSDSSDDEKDIDGNKTTKLKIVDVAENDQPSSPEEKNTTEPVPVVVEKSRKKKKAKTRSRQSRPRSTNTSERSRKKPVHTGLNGNYWNVVQYDRHAHTTSVDRSQLADDETTSSSGDEAHEKLETLLRSTSSSSSDELRTLLYRTKTFITCRSPADSFFLCQVLQDVFNDTKRIRIRWCSLADENGDETKVDENTHFKLDYADTLDPNTVLTGIGNVVRHPDKTISLKKQDIIETNRLLERSIKGITSSPEEPMDLSAEENKKSVEETEPVATDKNETTTIEPTPVTPKKRKTSSESAHKPPIKKRIRKTSGEPAPIKKRRRTQDIAEIVKPPKKTATKPVTTPKAQLFKVQSNRWLKENSAITDYRKDPFFEDNSFFPFISSVVQSKLAIRAVLTDDTKLLKLLIEDVDRVCSVHINRGLHNDLTAIHYAIQNDNIEMLEILIQDLKNPKKNRCPFPTVAMPTQSTGRSNTFTFGFRTAKIMASRGAKEGNNALNKDEMKGLTAHDCNIIIDYALKNNCSQKVYDFLLQAFPNKRNRVYDNIFHVVRAGHRKLAANIIKEIKDNTFHGFNNIHYQVLLYDNEDLTVNRATSVIKKSRENFQLTPIHCAAINPNLKYLKQLLSIMPEYNILDKYERRPIHFAAACEGPEPLEFLLSKKVNFNDADRGGNSPLHVAVMNGRAINAEILLRTAKEKAESNDPDDQTVHQKFGLASINRMNQKRFYPLHLAVLNNHLECVKVLLEFGADVDALTSTSSGKLSSLILACQKGHLKIVKYLIENGAKVEFRDRFKRTPLIHACMCGHAHIVSYLLRMGANAKVFDSSSNSALHYAIAYGWYFCVRLLIEAGANVNAINSWQTTCLAAGFLKGHFGLCDYLLSEHDININFQTDDGLTLVMLTVSLEVSTSSLQQLDYVANTHNADCTCVDANGSNAFHYLASNPTRQDGYMDDDSKQVLRTNFFKMAQILLDHKCDSNKINNKAQTPLMIALESGNFILVDYLINVAKVDIALDISHDGKTVLHYFAAKSDEYVLVQTFIKLQISDEIKKMGQMFDSAGRTPFHYCASKFHDFCRTNKTSKVTDKLKTQYQSIFQAIEYCLESIGCDPDAEIKVVNQSEKFNIDDILEDNNNTEEKSNGNIQSSTDINHKQTNSKLKEKSIFALLSTVEFADSTMKHPLEIFLKKTKNLNVLHHETQRTPLLDAIFSQEHKVANMLLNHPACDINLSTSILANELQQTPLILACKLQLLPVIRELLNHEQCNILAHDYQSNQAIHYYLSTSNRSKQYIEILNLFIEKIKSVCHLNLQGKSGRTPLHIAVYHNTGTLESNTEVEQLLIDNGSDLLLKDDLGNIPLHNVFINKTVNDDPVELCDLIIKAMKYKSLDSENNDGNTPLHIAVAKCSIVCVMVLQQYNASLSIENKLSNSIVGTCIVSGHLGLFINFLHQSIDINLTKLYTFPNQSTTSETSQNKKSSLQAIVPGRSDQKDKSLIKKDHFDLWYWKYVDNKTDKQNIQQSLIYMIIQQNWQGALSLILDEPERFHLSSIQILEAVLLNNKLNLFLRLLLRLKNKNVLHTKNSHEQNLFHLLANLDQYDEDILQQILSLCHEYHIEWNSSDKYGSYPLHYACVKKNFIIIDFLREKYSIELNLNQIDAFDNTAIGLLFWTIPSNVTFDQERIRSLITSNKQLDCLCHYDNESAINPLSFGYINSSTKTNRYPPMKSDNSSTNVRISPLINAVVHNNFQLVKFLLQLGADVNFSDDEKRTPLMHAVRQNNIDIVKLLLNKDYSLDNNEAKSATKQRVSTGGKTVQSYFLGATTVSNTIAEIPSDQVNKSEEFRVTSSIDLNASDSLGRTCIHHLVQPFPDGSYTSNIELLCLLHKSGASLTKLDLAGLSPLQYGAINGCQYLCDKLTQLTNDETNSIQATIERFYINDPNKNLLDQPDFYFDAQQLINKYTAKYSTNVENNAYEVDSLSGMSITGEVMIDIDKNEPYDVRLTKIDATYGIYGFYNFYRMQIIRHKSKSSLYFLFTRWGRIGDDGQHQLTPYASLDECKKEFIKIFREKTGNAWKDTNQFEPKPKRYTLVKLNERQRQKYPNVPIDFHRLQSEQSHPPSKLQSSVFKNFLKILINRQAIRKNVDKTQLDVEWMPVSQLKPETLEKARQILIEIKKAIEKKRELNLKVETKKSEEHQSELKLVLESIYKYTNQYYTIVPLRGFTAEKLPILDNENLVRTQEKIVHDLLELELSYKIFLGAQFNLKDISPFDYLYKSMNCQFEAMNKDDIDSQLILRYIWATASNVKVEQIFKIARPNEDERLFKTNLDNHYLLWHGTNICNLISILSRGLLVEPLEADSTGSLFGKGIYTADTFTKSLSYCSGVTDSDGERCFMILCEVALGNVKEVTSSRSDDDHTKPLDISEYQSRKGVGENVPDPRYTITRNYGVRMPLGTLIQKSRPDYHSYLRYNEYIVYDESQVALRYLVQFRR